MDGLRQFCLAIDYCHHFGFDRGNCHFLLFCTCKKSAHQLHMSCHFCDLWVNSCGLCMRICCARIKWRKTDSSCCCPIDCWNGHNSHCVCLFHENWFHNVSLSNLDFAWCNAFSWNLHVYFLRMLSIASYLLWARTHRVLSLLAHWCVTDTCQ